MTKITIITVTYNAASVLQRTLDSISQQTYQHIEHLIIDGASKDETVTIAEHYKEKAAYEVVILSEPDHGLYDAMNKGLHKATGDYLVFMNAGDTLHAENSLEIVVEGQRSKVKGRRACCYLWRYGDCGYGRTIPASAPTAPTPTAQLEIIPTGYARLSPGILCPHGYCPSKRI